MIFFSDGLCGCAQFATFYEALHLDSATKRKAVCKLLDIKNATLERYLSGKAAPPAAMVKLLFMESSYGRSATDSHTHQAFVYERMQREFAEKSIAALQLRLDASEQENAAIKQASSGPPLFAANAGRF